MVRCASSKNTSGVKKRKKIVPKLDWTKFNRWYENRLNKLNKPCHERHLNVSNVSNLANKLKKNLNLSSRK